jgi:hypothetical protein
MICEETTPSAEERTPAPSPPVRAKLPRLGDRRRVGEVAVAVSPVCLGVVGDPRVVPAAFDAGIIFFFVTADMHWPHYEALRRGLAMLFARGGGVRDAVVVGAVSYVAQPEFCYGPFHEVVQEVPGLDRVDVTIAGGAYPRDLTERLVAYRQHRQGGLPGVRGTGASFHDRVAARDAVVEQLVDLAFVRYNVAHRGAEDDLFPALPAERRALVYCFKSTTGRLDEAARQRLGLTANDWAPRVVDHYRFVLGRPEIDGLLCALGAERHVAELDEALAEGPLDEDDLQYMRDLGDLAAGRARLVGRG